MLEWVIIMIDHKTAASCNGWPDYHGLPLSAILNGIFRDQWWPLFMDFVAAYFYAGIVVYTVILSYTYVEGFG